MTSVIPSPNSSVARNRRIPAALLLRWGCVIALVMATLAPTIPWPQFSGDSEDLVAQAVLQIRNGGPWWIPMLGNEPRIKKPPLPTWIAAAAVRDSTLRGLPSTDPEVREAAYRQLAWDLRWPSLAAECGMLIAVACLAQLTCGPAHVVPSILIFATTVMFLRFGRSATTDVYLTLFVSIANAFLALAIFRQRYWLGLIGGGIALGLALMCKGPVSLVQTLFPFVVFLGLQRFTRCRRGISMGTITRDIRIPAILGATAMLAIGLPWYLTVLIRYREASGTLLKELDRQGAGLPPNTTFLGYWVLLPNLMPWIALFIAGIFVAGRYFRKSRRLGFLLILVVAPIAFMSCFPDRRDRYLFPMISPISILCAHAALLLKRSFPPRNVAAKLLWWGHWTTLLVLAIGVPPALWFFLKDRAHQPAISIPLATSILLTGIVLVLAALTLHRRVPLGFVYSTALLMLLLNAFFLYGWSRSVAGLSEMKPVADLLHYAFPTGKVVYYDPPPDGKPATFDLDIYLDRSVPVLSEWPAADQGVAAVVMLVKPGQPLPEFPGWTIWRDLVSRNHHWYMLVPTNYLSHK